jgi:O-antigen/teichoic acid export membrane protein
MSSQPDDAGIQTDAAIIQPEPVAPGVGGQALRGAAWMSAATWGGYFINLVAGVALARLLTPLDFGTLGLAESLLAMLNMLSSWGLAAAIVYREEIDETFRRTALMLALLLGAGIFGLAACIAVIWRVNEPLPALILVILAFLQIFLISAQLPQVYMERRMDFRRVSLVIMAAVLAESATALALAATGFGVWSLVAGRLAGGLTQIFAYWALAGWRPALGLDRKLAGWFFSYGKNFFVFNNLGVFQNKFDDLSVGVLVGKSTLGLYGKAYLLSELFGQTIAPNLNSVLLPTFTRLRDDLEQLTRAYDMVVWALWRLMLPFSILLALLAPQVINVVFGSQWLPMTPIMRLLLVYASLLPLNRATRVLLVALGQERGIAQAAVFQTLFFGPAVLIFTLIGGAPATAVAVGLSSLLGIYLLVRLAQHHIVTRLAANAVVPSLAGGLAAVGTWLAGRWGWPALPDLPFVLASSVSYVALYIVGLWALERRRLRTGLQWSLHTLRAARASAKE